MHYRQQMLCAFVMSIACPLRYLFCIVVTRVTMGGDLQWLQWLQLGVTFSQVVWLIGC